MAYSAASKQSTSKQSTSKQGSLQRFFLRLWFGKHWLLWLLRIPLLPLSLLYQLLLLIHGKYQRKCAVNLPVPVVVIGNITVGGTGKTPVVISIANALKAKGLHVGIISRGYRSQAPHYPYSVKPNDAATLAGDEPLLILQSTACPVVIAKDRIAAGQLLLQNHPETDIILSDDGLQHYRLQRDVEIIVIDGQRGLGNHLLIPAGPLREPASRLVSADWVLFNSPEDEVNNERVSSINVAPRGWRHIKSQTLYPLDKAPWLQAQTTEITAISGIGNPQRFFTTVQSLGVECSCHAYDDHYIFSESDFSNFKNNVILMTEKDAVKCLEFAGDDWWSLVVDIEIPEPLINSLYNLKAH